MHIQLTTHEIACHLHGDEYANFSRKGAYALAEYLEEWEREIEEQKELDVIEIRCSYTEYDNLFDWATNHYGDALVVSELEFSDDVARETIRDMGVLIEFDGGIIVSEF